jgi:hypothetical protein
MDNQRLMDVYYQTKLDYDAIESQKRKLIKVRDRETDRETTNTHILSHSPSLLVCSSFFFSFSPPFSLLSSSPPSHRVISFSIIFLYSVFVLLLLPKFLT